LAAELRTKDADNDVMTAALAGIDAPDPSGSAPSSWCATSCDGKSSATATTRR
jgi:hypothetical protein